MFRFKCLYFLTLRAASLPKNNLLNSINFLKVQGSFFCSNQKFLPETQTSVSKLPKPPENNNHEGAPTLKSLESGSAANVNLTEFGSALFPSYNFAAYADKSPLLQQFIKLGVQLFKFEKDPKIGEFLLTLDFDKDVKPYLLFLKDNGIHPDKFGSIITNNPFLFKEKLEDLMVRMNYLQSKKFTKEMISNIILKYPKWLSLPVKVVDQRLGFLQHLLKLKGNEVRSIISVSPAVISQDKKKLSCQIYILREDMEFSLDCVRQMCVEYPGILKRNGYEICNVYDYLTQEMKVPRHLIQSQPYVFSCRKFILKSRHMYLQSLGRAQYNPKLPGYVNLITLVKTNDEEFCSHVAKTDVALYNKFLKTL